MYNIDENTGLFFIRALSNSYQFLNYEKGVHLKMPFRTLELTKPTEIHIKESQIQIQQGEELYSITNEDLYQGYFLHPCNQPLSLQF